MYGKFPLNSVNSKLDHNDNHLTKMRCEKVYFQLAICKHCEPSEDILPWNFKSP